MESIYRFLLLMCLSAGHVLADFSVISELEYNQTSVSRVLFDSIDDFFVVLLIEPKANNRGHPYSVRVYEMVNGTLTKLPTTTREVYYIPTSDIHFSAKRSTLSVGRISFEASLCSLRRDNCQKLFIFNDNGVAFYTLGTERICGPDLSSTSSKLIALTQNNRHDMLIFSQADQIRGTICTGNIVKQIRFSCTDLGVALNTVKSVSIRIDGEAVEAFGLLSNSDTAALCVFFFQISSVRAVGISNITETDKIVLPSAAGSPIGLAVATADLDHVAYVLHTNGRIAKVCSSIYYRVFIIFVLVVFIRCLCLHTAYVPEVLVDYRVIRLQFLVSCSFLSETTAFTRSTSTCPEPLTTLTLICTYRTTNSYWPIAAG